MPLPLPLAPLVTVSHAALLTAVRGHPEPAVTATVPELVPATTEADDGEIANVHDVPACVTVNVCPAIVTVPVRGAVDVFAAIE